jgi:hypothetical protein
MDFDPAKISLKRKAKSRKQKAKSYCSGWMKADFVQHRIKMITLITMILFFLISKDEQMPVFYLPGDPVY